MEPAVRRSGFFKHREHEGQSKPVLRSSALFYVLERPGVRTEFLLFNYWLHKRGIEGLTLSLRLRSMDGNVVHEEAAPLSFAGARTVQVGALLERAGRPGPFEGSLEIEILGSVNLTIPYPAIIARYVGPDWHSTAHSYSRVLSESSGDVPDRLATLQETCEGNWTIHATPDLETFFVVHNGPAGVDPHDLRLTLVNHAGRRLEGAVRGLRLAAHETAVFWPERYLDVSGHLEGRPGCLEVSGRVAGVFPRLLCGHRHRRSGAMSVDHSNFNYTGQAGAEDCLPVEGAGTRKPLGFAIPAYTGGGWACWADFYPTYPDRTYPLLMRSRDLQGQEVARAERVLGDGETPGLFRMDVSALLQDVQGAGSVDVTVSHERRVPTRFHMGIHYALNDGLPAFLIDGPLPYTFQGIRSRWFPALLGGDTRTHLLLSNQIVDASGGSDLEFEVSAYNARGDAPLKGRVGVKAGATLARDVEALLPGAETYFGGEAGWVYLHADRPQMSVMHYLMVKGRNSVAADHAF